MAINLVEFSRKYWPQVSIYHDWDSFIFWQPMNWRDFTVIALSGEVSPNRWYEIHFAILGFHFWSQWLRQPPGADDAD